jgi:hypothetical protein
MTSVIYIKMTDVILYVKLKLTINLETSGMGSS